MKKLLLLATAICSVNVWADCASLTTTDEVGFCYSKQVSSLKKQLNQTYMQVYKQTEAKKELDDAQKAWLNYKEKQCGNFTVADAGMNSGQVVYDLACQSDLIKYRIKFLKTLLPRS
ncbi:lysozyme inhibitor LprI family protein [Acinetobacter sp. MD2(2019)]|uniref:lysozyme inhibitor LprI family protein n=1 Tax=Acinetobacter sp. MD2(2019) TaxID=2605273 RepID=UPI002D1F0B47|nr:lysozyme inhibitor LprI family protein [Acinetobacter sp. MD2(2019)]MEB3755025.1 DUF1311 domain-containing protein [Acinetobacter sp. MD2(2019)]